MLLSHFTLTAPNKSITKRKFFGTGDATWSVKSNSPRIPTVIKSSKRRLGSVGATALGSPVIGSPVIGSMSAEKKKPRFSCFDLSTCATTFWRDLRQLSNKMA